MKISPCGRWSMQLISDYGTRVSDAKQKLKSTTSLPNSIPITWKGNV